jgi:hypothetical protein
MVVCRAGGLHKYQSAATDALEDTLMPRFRFRARLNTSIRLCYGKGVR